MIQSELSHLIEEHTAKITVDDLESLAVRLPELRDNLEKYQCREYPFMADQVEFLALLVEDTASGLNQNLPFAALAEAAFALNYLDNPRDIIPDDVPGIGLLDDAMIVSLVLQRNQHLYRDHPRAEKLRWPVVPVRFEAAFARSIRSTMVS